MLRTITVIIMLVGVILLTGCKFTQEDYIQLYNTKEQQALKTCNNKRMDMVTVYTQNLETWIAVCVTQSPCKIYRFEV